MKSELKDKWVKALRSGKYTQGYEYLNNNNKLCCLGVLCEVAGVCSRTGVIWPEITHYGNKLRDSDYNVGEEYDESETELTPQLLRDFDLDEFEQAELIKLNDEDNLNFPAIADYIEKTIPSNS